MVSNFDLDSYLREMEDSGYSIESMTPFYQSAVTHVLTTLETDKSANVVDLGTAIGHVPMVLKAAGYQKLSCVDASHYRKDFLEAQGFSFFKVDLERQKLPFDDNSVDMITCFEVIEHLDNPLNMLTEALRVLRVGGSLVISTPDLRRVGAFFYEDPTHVRPYIKEGLARTLRTAGFKNNLIRNWGGRYKLHKIPILYNKFPSIFFLGSHLIAVAKK